jgi:hypothetical protein
LATPNYGYEKRQKELAKKRKKEDKLKAKTERKPDFVDGDEAQTNGAEGALENEDAAVTQVQPEKSSAS